MIYRNNIKYDHIVQISNSSAKFQKFALRGAKHTQKKVAVEVVDQKESTMTIKVASQLNDIS